MVLGDRLDSSLSFGLHISRADNARRDGGGLKGVCNDGVFVGTSCRLEAPRSVDVVRESAGDEV